MVRKLIKTAEDILEAKQRRVEYIKQWAKKREANLTEEQREKRREYARQYYLKNREKLIERTMAVYKKHKEILAAHMALIKAEKSSSQA
jgi:hypothetical protein